MPAHPAIVSTVRDAGAVLDSFIRYHQAIGFEYIFLYFDDPQDPFVEKLVDYSNVVGILHDAKLRARWRKLRHWQDMRGHIDTEVMARQVLNCEHATSLAAAAGCDWLLHIDSDEAFACTSGTAPMLFTELTDQGFDLARFMNFEALPEQAEAVDYFRDVTLFKVNPMLRGKLRYSSQQIGVIAQARFPQGDHFNLYGNGKAAGKINRSLVPANVHRFERRGLFGRKLEPKGTIVGDNAVILHYANCGMQQFMTKYKTLGNFQDKWFGEQDVINFHREARNVCATGDEEAMQRFFHERVMLHPQENLELLLKEGVLARIDAPANLLRQLAAAD
jgi:hypothetical protein